MRTWKRQLGVGLTMLALAAVAWAASAPNRQEVLKKREALIERLNKTIRQKMNVPPSDGVFLKFVAESSRAKRALEIGSSNGYSAVWIGSGLEQTGGHLWTIEIDAGRAKECRENVQEAGLEKVVTSIEGDAFKEMPKIAGEFDFVFIDAWKPDYDEFFNMVFPRLTEGGVILAHNAVRQAGEMKDYLDIVTKHPELDTVFVITTLDPNEPMRDGFAISYRKKKE